VPGVSAAEAGGDFFRYLVGISYTADVKLPWWPTDGGAIAPFEGSDATHGSRGDWPLPPDATAVLAVAGRRSWMPAKTAWSPRQTDM
jgi:hypothetical protein